MNKICTNCKIEKPISLFSKHKYSKDGFRSYCKLCGNIYSKFYYENNKKVRIEYQKLYNKNAPENIKERKRQYNKEYSKQYRQTEKGKLSKIKSETKRKRLTKENINDLTIVEKNVVLFLQNYKCISCEEYFDKVNPTLDHIVPIIKGGGLTKDNIQMLCLSCNSSKQDQIIDFRNETHKNMIGII